MSLTARYLEANGISTVLVGSARDIVEHCGIPRFLFTDFPLGNSCGRPGDIMMQRTVVGEALTLLERAALPRTTAQSSCRWSADESWREGYMPVREEDTEQLRAMGLERRRRQAAGLPAWEETSPRP